MLDYVDIARRSFARRRQTTVWWENIKQAILKLNATNLENCRRYVLSYYNN